MKTELALLREDVMERTKRNKQNLIQYGVNNLLASKAAANSLSLTKIRTYADVFQRITLAKYAHQIRDRSSL